MRAFPARPDQVRALFGDWEKTMIWSCLQGVMGRLYANHPTRPTAALALLGDFGFLAGEPDPSLAAARPEGFRRNFMILVPQNEAWAEIIEHCWPDRCRRGTRYAFRKDPSAFDQDRLLRMAGQLPDGTALVPLDETLYRRCWDISWCRDWVAQYPAWELYRQWALGTVALREGEPVAGASAYSSWRGGIEIEIDTRADCRRQGLARACGARLILDCLERGWYPSWDAQNPGSAALAQQLGYRLDRPYPAYEVWGERVE